MAPALAVESLLQEGDEAGEKGWVAQNFEQESDEGCDCHGSPFLSIESQLDIGANH